MKVDPYKHQERYNNWKEKTKEGIVGVSKFNSFLIKQYLDDMEHGLNVSSGSQKGGRSYIRLNTLRDKLQFFAKRFEFELKLEKFIDVNEEQLLLFFSRMKKGDIKRDDGKNYSGVSYYVKSFKAFWHWWIKINKKKGVIIDDITKDLDTTESKPDWVYLNEEQVRKLWDNAKYDYKVLIMFLYDSGIRSPTEMMNVRVSDFFNDFKELSIREETSKTFGRRIKLMLCSDYVKDYVKQKDLKGDDLLFCVSPYVVNKYLQRLATKLFGDVKSLAGQKYSQLTMYDLRHNSACYWLPRYKSESALKFRFGWKKSDMVHYYTELLGMRDTISQEDLLVDTSKTEIERKLSSTEKENFILKERINNMEEQMKKILEMVERVGERIK